MSKMGLAAAMALLGEGLLRHGPQLEDHRTYPDPALVARAKAYHARVPQKVKRIGSADNRLRKRKHYLLGIRP